MNKIKKKIKELKKRRKIIDKLIEWLNAVK